MAVHNYFAGGTHGDTVTVANSATGGDPFDAANVVTGGTLAFDNTKPGVGAGNQNVCCKVATGATAGVSRVGWTTLMGDLDEHWGRMYLYMTAFPTVAHRIYQSSFNGSNSFGVTIDTFGRVQMLDSLGQVFASERTPTAIALNAWNRIEFTAKAGPTGTMQCKLYRTDPYTDNAPDEHINSGTARNLGASTFTNQYFFGVATSLANVAPFFIDLVGLSELNWIGAWPPVEPTDPAVTRHRVNGSLVLARRRFRLAGALEP